MIEALISQLEELLPELPKKLTEYSRSQEGPLLRTSPCISRYETNTLFLGIFSGLHKICVADSAVSEDKFSEILKLEIASLRDITQTKILQGANFKEFIRSIKLIRRIVAARITGLPATEKNILYLYTNFCILLDFYELEISNCWETIKIEKNQAGSGQANKVLTTEKAIYKSIFDTTSNLVLVTDGAGCIIEVNPEVQLFFPGQKVIGRFCGDLLKLPFNNIEQLQQYAEGDTSRELSILSAGVTRTFSLQMKPFTEGTLLILSDITCAIDNRQALENRVTERTRELAKSEKILDTIFQSVGKGILLIDSDLEIFKANEMASEIYGIPQQVLVGTSYRSLTDESGMELMSEVCETLADGEVRNIECISNYVDGRNFPSMLTVASMNLEGQVFWPIIVWDISEQKELETELRNQKLQAEEMNVTLRNVLGTIESQRKELEQNIRRRIQTSILPGLEKIQSEGDDHVRASYLLLLKDQLIDMTSGFYDALDRDLLKLSKTELQICKYIRAGLTGKEICDAMSLAFETIQTHRKNIRKKLGLRGRNVNLYTFLVEKKLEQK